MTLREVQPTSNADSRFGGKRSFFDTHEDDNTFLPPALSSYSIALLNEKTKLSPQQVTGVYKIDFPETNKMKSNLRNKLSVHFKESITPESEANYRVHQFESEQYSFSKRGSDAETTTPTNDQNNNNTNTNTNTTGNNTNNSINTFQHNTSALNSFSMSTHNYSSHTHNTTSEYNDEAMDGSPPNLEAKILSANTPSNTSMSAPSAPGSSHSNLGLAHGSSVRRLRGTRRFGRVLGPPKRAVKVEAQDSTASTQGSAAAMSFGDSNNDIGGNSLSAITPIGRKTPTTNENDAGAAGAAGADSKRINPDSVFFKTLNKMKAESEIESVVESNVPNKPSKFESQKSTKSYDRMPTIEQMFGESKASKYQEFGLEHLQRNQNNNKVDSYPGSVLSDKQSLVNGNKENGNIFSSSAKLIKEDGVRVPLNNISQNYMNRAFGANDLDNFKKPKLPKTVQEHVPVRPQTPPYTQKPLPPPASSSSDDGKKKKCITINGNQYEKLEVLGRGGTSKVYKVKSVSRNKLFAIKKVTFDQFDESCIQGFKGEIDLLLKLKDADRVVKLIDYAIGEGSIYLVLECGDNDLAHVIQNRLSINNALDINFVKYHAIEVLKCVQAVHDAGIVHSDLKPANFLFIKGVLKIIDFGIANAVPDHTANIYRESQIGTPSYMAPEALVEVTQTFPGLPIPESLHQMDRQKNTWKVGKPSDVWSCGCIIYQMIYGKPPYGAYSGNQRIMAIMNPQIKIQFPSKGMGNVKVPQSAIELMQKCLKRNPSDRWTVDECLNSDFLNPKIISEGFIRDLVHLAVNFGYNNRVNGNGLITADVYDKLVDTVLKQIEDLNYG